ncbi:NB-ARC domain-containing protein [Streptosporangium sp. NPDC051022]|uniref:ATP-binding protein n=1 Tax=Streptosporangium sp. NPDC051022 TaxID=3155752 RepID=UPI00342C85B4
MDTAFVGRRVEIAQVIRLLRESRLVTLTGLGGVGKTRLARRVVEEISEDFPGGFWQVELSRLTDPHLLPGTVADSVGVADQSPRPPQELLADWLSPRRALLMLDTCEHLVGAVASLADTLLRAAPGLRVLVTGRQPLGVSGEHVYPVPPLPIEDAVALLRDRAGLPEDFGGPRSPAPPAAPGIPAPARTGTPAAWGDGAEGAGVLADLCAALDCVPLAIELAAVRLRTVPPRHLARELADRYRLLGGEDGEDGDGHESVGHRRHASLRTAVGWSHELCTPAERLLWARLSVFALGFDLEAAEQVCSGGPLPVPLVLEALTGLVEKSLVQREEHPSGVRLRMLDTVREFGAEWLLRLGETQVVQGRHRDHYLGLARRCATEWPGSQVEWYGRMRAERHNFRKVFEVCLADPGGVRTALDLAGALWFLWVCCGMAREGRHHLEAALRSETEPGRERTRALWVCAWVALLQGDLDAARERLARCRAEDSEGAAAGYVAQMEGFLALTRRDFARAADLLREAIVWHTAEGDVLSGLLPCHTLAALSLLAAGRPEESGRMLARGQALCDKHGEEWSRAQMEYVLAWAEHVKGRAPGTLRHARAALAGAGLFEDVLLTVACVELAAWAATAGPEHTATAGPERMATVGPERTVTAAVAAAREGALLLGAAQAVWDSSGLPQFGSPILVVVRQRAVVRAVEVLGGGEFATRFTEGKALDLRLAVKYVLGEKIS